MRCTSGDVRCALTFDMIGPPPRVHSSRFWRRSIVVQSKLHMGGDFRPTFNQRERPMTKMIFVSLPVTDLTASIAFYRALEFEQMR
jgi:hypothetical protein